MSSNAATLTMARNALLVAGHEMGTEGEHWPLIKNTMAALVRAYEMLRAEQESTHSLRDHMHSAITNYDLLLQRHTDKLDHDTMNELQNFTDELRAIYHVRFGEGESALSALRDLAASVEGMLPPETAAALLR